MTQASPTEAAADLAHRYHRYRIPGQPVVVAVRGLGVDGRRHRLTMARGFPDSAIAYERGGATTVLPIATRPWQSNDGGRAASVLQPGHYIALPQRVNARGKASHEGRPTFVVCDQQGKPIVASGGVYAIYPSSLAIPHIGCQVLPAEEWPAFLRAVGGVALGFRYVLVNAWERTPVAAA